MTRSYASTHHAELGVIPADREKAERDYDAAFGHRPQWWHDAHRARAIENETGFNAFHRRARERRTG